MPPGKAISVLHVIDSSGPGGSETVVATIVAKNDDHSVLVPEGFGWLARELGPMRCRVVAPSDTGAVDWVYARGIRASIRASGCRIVHAHSFDSALYSCLAAVGLPVRVVATFHGRKDVVRPGFQGIIKWFILRRLQGIVTVSRDLHSLLVSRHPALAGRTVTIPNGVDTNRFHPANRPTRLSEAASPFRIGALGNVRPEKDYGNLIAAAKFLIDAGFNIEVEIAGDDRGDLAESLRRRALDECGARLRFIGFVSDPMEFLNSIDAYVLCSSSEGLPLSLLQAAAAQVPIVVTRCGGPEEVFGSHNGALMVPTGDAKALAAALESVIESEPLRSSIALAARARVLNAYSERAMLQEYATLYSQHAGSDER